MAEKRNWGSIALYTGTGLVALLIIGFAAWPAISKAMAGDWKERAAAIPGLTNFIDPASPNYNQPSTQANHVPGDQTYQVNPPVGGNHNDYWQNCMGDVYPAQIADEHAVHSLEHGAVWITYRPDLPQDQIDQLAERVRDVPYMLMSPHLVLVEREGSADACGVVRHPVAVPVAVAVARFDHRRERHHNRRGRIEIVGVPLQPDQRPDASQ